MDLIQDFKRMALCFAIMASAVVFVALSGATRPDFAMQRHPAWLHMPGPARARFHQRRGEDPMSWMSVVAHRGLFVVSNLAGLVQ